MPDNIVQDIKDRLNLVDVISGYIQLKKAGTNFKALCPFHSEKTPSLNVSPQRQIWHCFGCGAGGDVFGFVMQYENMDFRQALELLAQKAGVQLPKFRPPDPKEQEEKDLLLRINDFAARLYQQVLKELRGKEALDYLLGRGLEPKTFNQWQIGYAPEEFHFLHSALLKKKVREEFLIKAGVCAKGEKGQIYDRFRGRIVFPVFDYSGQIVGFSARILPKFDDGKAAKYINSAESLIYQKSKILFGLNFAKDEIRKKNEVVIVEGQMDCISSHQAGIKNVVASSGTALTAGQLNLLKRLTSNLKFCFDADEAGQLAMRRAVESALSGDFTIKVIVLQSAKDPDELIRKNFGLWQTAIDSAPLFLDYYFAQAFKDFGGSVEEKKQISKELLPLIGRLLDPIERDHYLVLTARNLGTEEKALRQALEKSVKAPALGTLREDDSFLPPIASVSPLEKEVLGGLLAVPEFLGRIKDQIEEGDFENPEIRALVLGAIGADAGQTAQDFTPLERAADEVGRKSISNFKDDGGLKPFSSLKGSVFAKEAEFMVESLKGELAQEAVLKRLLKSYNQLKVKSLKKKQKILQNEIARAEAQKEKENQRRLQVEFARISALRAEYEGKL